MMWSEPFIVRKEEEEIAVFLLDTQGNFDHDSEKELGTKVFALSLLLSSVFIFNIHHQVQGDDLDYLQFATEYSRVAKDVNSDFAPFQSLIFLVRDWCELDDFEYGLEEGQKYLEKKVLKSKPQSKNTSLTRVREYLRESFTVISCYLMPDPGRKVTIRRKGQTFTGCVEDIDPEFVEHVNKLVNILLKPENLVVKDRMSARMLLDFIIRCCNAIKSDADGKLPNPLMLMEAAAESLATEALIKSLEKYQDSMMDLDSKSQTFLSWEDFDEKENIFKKNIHDSFYKDLKFGGNSFKEGQMKKLTSLLARAKEKFVRRNQLKKIKETSDIKEMAASLLKTYEEEFLKVLDDDKLFNDESILAKTHSDLFGEVFDTFDSELSKYSAEVKLQEEEALKDEIDDHYELIKLQYSYKMEILEQVMQQNVCNSVEVYEKEIKKALTKAEKSGKKIVFEKLDVKARIVARCHFDSQKSAVPECMHASGLKQMENHLENFKNNFLSDIAKKKNIPLSLLKRMDEKYAELLANETGGKILSLSALDDVNNRFSMSAIEVYGSCKDEMRAKNFTFDDWIENQKEMFEASLRHRKFLEAMATSELLKIKVDQKKKIFQAMEDMKKLLYEEEELEKKLEALRTNLLNEMDKVQQDWYSSQADGERLCAKELEEFIYKCSVLARKKNESNKIRMQHIIDVETLEACLDYHEAMERELNGVYVEPEVLDEMHNRWKNSKIFQIIPGMTDEANEGHRQIILNKIDEDFDKFKKWNENNQSFFTRVVKNVSADFAAARTKGKVAGVVAVAKIGFNVATGCGRVVAAALGSPGIAIEALVTWSLTKKRLNQYFHDVKTRLRSNIKERLETQT